MGYPLQNIPLFNGLWKVYLTYGRSSLDNLQHGTLMLSLTISEYDLPLQDLSENLVILFCVLSGERKQTVKALNIKNMVLGKGK